MSAARQLASRRLHAAGQHPHRRLALSRRLAGRELQLRASEALHRRRWSAAKFDAFFMADHLAVLNMPIEALKRSHTVTSFEPFTLLSALARRDRAYRPGRHRLDHLRRALSHRAPLRVARPPERRPRRLEHRHDLQSGRGAEFRARRAHGARRALSPRARVLRRRHRPVGQLRRRRLHPRRRGTASISIRPSCTCSTTRANSCRCAVRSTSRGRCRAGR